LVLFAFFVSVISIPSIVFRLDDIQCGWNMNTSFMIMDAFFKFNVPLSVGVITGFGDCYQPGLLQRFNQANGNLEVASHSVHHVPMTGFNYSDQLFEVANSKATLEAFLGSGTVRTFIPPTNVFNYDTISVLQGSGYDIISPQCTVAQLFYPYLDYMCTPNMYSNRPSFFPRINGVIHMPTGASIANFGNNVSVLLTTDQLLSGTNNDCTDNGLCSIQSQINAMANLTDTTDASWSVIMMHPQDFPEDANFIESFFSAIFTKVKPSYRLVTFSQLAGPKGSRPSVVGNGATTWISTNSNPASSPTPSSSSAPTKTITMNVATLIVLAMALARM